MKYRLADSGAGVRPVGIAAAVRQLAPLVAGEARTVAAAVVAVLVTSLSSLLSPLLTGRAVDQGIARGELGVVVRYAGILLAVYVAGMFATYVQTLAMGAVGQRLLFSVRHALFEKLQQLPIAFFTQNKAGDLISRINNDTSQLNQFVSQGLGQLAGNAVLMTGAGLFLLGLHLRLGIVALLPALAAFVVTRLVSPWVQRRNVFGLRALGAMSGEIQESLSTFKVIVAFNRRDYFRQRFAEANERSFAASVASGMAGGIFLPLYGLAANAAQLAVLATGIALVAAGELTIGMLIAFLGFAHLFYLPLRQLAAVWSSFQLALAGLERISGVLRMDPDLAVVSAEPVPSDAILVFEAVSFGYPDGGDVLRGVSLALERGRTYALVGPTGGGKTTTASLMARLYDPTAGRVLLDGRDLRSYRPEERARKIGFILQEPILFTGRLRDNILYGNDRYRDCSGEELARLLAERNLDGLLTRFTHGLETEVTGGGEGISLGQKQLIAFMRAVLRDPEVLILDEATANIDTVTERLLEQLLARLPASTTRVVIAHRLSTIAGADEIFFVNGGTITAAGSMEHALDLLLHGRRAS